MGVWLVGADVLASSRFVVSPLVETVAAMKAFDGKGTHPAQVDWLDAYAPVYRRRLRRDPFAAALAGAALRPRWVADFLVTPPDDGDGTFDGDLAGLRATTPEHARAQLRAEGVPVPSELDGADLNDRTAELLTWVWDLALRPGWPRRQRLLEADIVARSHQLAIGGWAAALPGMRPDMRWAGDGRLQVNAYDHPPVDLTGARLSFVPTLSRRGVDHPGRAAPAGRSSITAPREATTWPPAATRTRTRRCRRPVSGRGSGRRRRVRRHRARWHPPPRRGLRWPLRDLQPTGWADDDEGGAAVRIVIAEDDALLREGLALLLRAEGLDVVATADGPGTFLDAVGEHRPDIAIVDVRMPPTHTDEGIVAAVEARRRRPGLAVLVLSAYVEQAFATDLLAHGSARLGYLLKERVGRVEEFLGALHRVAGGGTAIDPEVVGQLLARSRPDSTLSLLSARERDVLALMAEGLGNTAIAQRLFVTDGAVHKHIRSIFAKLGLAPDDRADRRVTAVLRYLDDTAKK